MHKLPFSCGNLVANIFVKVNKDFSKSAPPPRPSVVPPSMSSNPIEQMRSGNIANIFLEVTGPVSREVEEEGNTYFQRIYNEVLELLKKFQTSGVQRKSDVFN